MTAPTPFFTWPGSSALSERFTEVTALETSYNGTEQRQVCRAFPRYGLSANFILFDGERSCLSDVEVGSNLLVPT